MKLASHTVPFDLFGSLTGYAHVFANYGKCNRGPSRFYRVNRLLRCDPITVLYSWRDLDCATPETTASCPNNSNRCN